MAIGHCELSCRRSAPTSCVRGYNHSSVIVDALDLYDPVTNYFDSQINETEITEGTPLIIKMKRNMSSVCQNLLFILLFQMLASSFGLTRPSSGQ